MAKPLAFTEASVRRAIAAVQKAGLPIKATSIGPDGTVTIFHDIVASSVQPALNGASSYSVWEDIQA
jgi:hypothetical protein